MPNRIVVLILSGRPPIQISIDNTDRYNRLRAHLTNYHEQEMPHPDPALPLITVGEVEQTLNVQLPPSAPTTTYRHKILTLFSPSRYQSR